MNLKNYDINDEYIERKKSEPYGYKVIGWEKVEVTQKEKEKFHEEIKKMKK